jgi:hypothetical protein
LHLLESNSDTTFTAAVDDIDGYFSPPDGNWTIAVHVGEQWGNVQAAWEFYASSWVLCYEPPPVPAPAGVRVARWDQLAPVGIVQPSQSVPHGSATGRGPRDAPNAP